MRDGVRLQDGAGGWKVLPPDGMFRPHSRISWEPTLNYRQGMGWLSCGSFTRPANEDVGQRVENFDSGLLLPYLDDRTDVLRDRFLRLAKSERRMKRQYGKPLHRRDR